MPDTLRNGSDQTSESAENIQVSQNKSGETIQNATNASSRLQNKSRFHQATAASQARSKNEAISKKPVRPKTPARQSSTVVKKGPMKSTTQYVDSHRVKGEPTKRSTPLNSTMMPKRSTPTNDKSLELNLDAWDASVINTVNRTGAGNVLDETAVNPMDVSAPAPQAVLFKPNEPGITGKKPDGTKPAVIKKALPQTGLKPKKQPAATGGRVSATAVKAPPPKKGNETNASADVSEDGEITDEMIDYVYYRYIQSQYIEMKSEQALAETKAQCEKQVFDAWMAYEDLAMKYNEKMKKIETWKTVQAMQASLKVLKKKLQPVVDVMDGLKDKFGKINSGLDAVKHNLVVQGIAIEDQQIARKELENMDNLFTKFLEDTEGVEAKVVQDMDSRLEMAEEYAKLAANFAEALRLSEDCKKLLNTAEQVAMQEASLRISMMQLERAEKRNKVDI